MKNLKKITSLITIAATLIPAVAMAKSEDKFGSAKNVIMMIPDGMSIETLTASRWVSEGYKLALDTINTGTVKVNNSSTPIADSAPAATAMATGFKSKAPFIATYPPEGGLPGNEDFDAKRAYAPLATVLEGAKRSGRSTGIVSTSNVQHATPAAFSSHSPNRKNYEILGEQQVYQNMDIVLGAGSKYLNSKDRKDKEDLISEIKNLGYSYITTRDELNSTKSNKVWGMFHEKEMAYDIDRDKNVEPSLEEMTTKALDILSKNDKGFFVMIEGSEIDWGAHANDPVATITDTLAFDKAVAAAKNFVDTHEDSVLIVAADHGTGGMTYGHKNISSGYYDKKVEDFTTIIKNAKMTGKKASEVIYKDKANTVNIFKENFGIDNLYPQEIEAINKADEKNIQAVVNDIISRRAHIGWTTGGHTAGDVALYCHANGKNIKTLKGNIFNNDIGKYMEDVLDIDLDELNKDLYVPAREAFENKGANVEYKETSKANFELQITKNNDKLVIPMDKNYAFLNGKKVELSGLSLNTSKNVYVPKDAIELIK